MRSYTILKACQRSPDVLIWSALCWKELWTQPNQSVNQSIDHIGQLYENIQFIKLSSSKRILNLWHASLLYVELSTKVYACWNKGCTLWWIFQQPGVIEPSLHFLNTLPMASESLCSFRKCPHQKKLLDKLGYEYYYRFKHAKSEAFNLVFLAGAYILTMGAVRFSRNNRVYLGVTRTLSWRLKWRQDHWWCISRQQIMCCRAIDCSL